MSTNDFLTFAGGGSANALSQTDYAALTTILANGFTSGVLPSARLNKVLRQCAAMSSALGELIKGSGLDALDDGNAATLLSNLKTAIYDQGGRVGHAYTGSDWAYLDRNRSLIIQWGAATITTANAYQAVSFATTFTTSVYQVIGGCNSVNSSGGAGPNSLSSCNIFANNVGAVVSFIAIGK